MWAVPLQCVLFVGGTTRRTCDRKYIFQNQFFSDASQHTKDIFTVEVIEIFTVAILIDFNLRNHQLVIFQINIDVHILKSIFLFFPPLL